jgi:hypothetical protein
MTMTQRRESSFVFHTWKQCIIQVMPSVFLDFGVLCDQTAIFLEDDLEIYYHDVGLKLGRLFLQFTLK